MRLSTQVPDPIVNTTDELLSDAYNTTGATGAYLAKTFSQGNTVISNKLNYNSKLIELIGRYGSGAYGVIKGLTLSYTTGLILTIASGRGLCDGIVEKSSSVTLNLPDNKANLYIWISQTGTITYVDGSLTPPYTRGIFLGTVTTSGGNITSTDTAGVVYLLAGGIPWREVGDTGSPASTPPNMALLTKSQLLTYVSTSSTSGYIPFLTNEAVQDVVGAMLTNSSTISATYDDSAGTIGINVNPTGIQAIHVDYFMPDSYNYVTATATVTLGTTDKNIQAIIPSGANRSVLLPTVSLGSWYRLYHAGTSNSLFLVNGTTTVGTLTSGQYSEVRPGFNSGTLSWPSSILGASSY